MSSKYGSAIAFVAFPLSVASCNSSIYSSAGLLQDLNKYCASRGQESLDKSRAYSRVESFFSPSLKTCVQAEVGSGDKNWEYEVLDVTHGFLSAPRLVKSPSPLHVSHHEYGRWAFASA